MAHDYPIKSASRGGDEPGRGLNQRCSITHTEAPILTTATFVLAIAIQQAPAAPVSAVRSTASLCAVSADPGYGLSVATPIQVGGGAMHTPARERQRPAFVGGPAHLADAAKEAVARWRSEPPRINGAPIARAVTVQVKFKSQ